MPAVSEIAKTETTLVFTGTNFFTADFDLFATLDGIKADSIVVDSANKVTATWTKGVPVIKTASKPVLSFQTTQAAKGALAHYAIMNKDVTNALTISSSSQSLQCSFAGGCPFLINAAGLASKMKSKPDQNYVTICGNKCEFSDAESSAQQAVCKLPYLSTSKSISSFKIQQSTNLYSGKYVFTGSEDYAKNLFDKNNMNYNEDTRAPCHAGMEFREGYVGILSKVRFFLGDKHDMTKYAKITKFQGSADGTSYTDLFTFDENVHTGWNYHEWKEAE